MLLKSRRSTRCPYLFLSTVLGGAVEVSVLERTIWKSGDPPPSLGVNAIKGAPAPEILVLVEVRDKGGGIENCRDGDGVSRDREGRA